MDTITAIHTRRSIRDYEKRPVERDIITDILWDAAQAPTTPVSGPFLFHVIEGAARIATPLVIPGPTGQTSRFFSMRRW
jgi:nitroreductase